MELKKFVVKKSQWLRGEGHYESFLLRDSDGKMCCLGFASLACGLDVNDIYNVPCPCDVDNTSLNKYPNSFFIENHINHHGYTRFSNSDLISKIMATNDDEDLNDDERILKLIDKFAELEIEVSFEE